MWEAFSTFRNFVTPAVTFIGTRVQNVWNFVQPYFASTGKCLATEGGAVVGLMTLSMISGGLSPGVENRALRIALIAASILCGVVGIMVYIHMLDRITLL